LGLSVGAKWEVDMPLSLATKKANVDIMFVDVYSALDLLEARIAQCSSVGLVQYFEYQVNDLKRTLANLHQAVDELGKESYDA
jgi:hypothetical protein